jgi:tRNA1(Val) A37 N6-methylase TrmN6
VSQSAAPPLSPDATTVSQGAQPGAGQSPGAVARDGFLGGRLMLEQPVSGHRAGLDAILLAASCPARTGQNVVDLGAGVGTAGLAVSARAGPLDITLVERDQGLIELAQRNAASNGMAAQSRIICAEVGAAGGIAKADLAPAFADHVIANPPFAKAGTGRASPDERRRAAHQLDERGLEPWFRWAAALLKQGGTFTLIHEPRALPGLLALCGNRFGGLAIAPIHPRAGVPATRIILQGIKGSRAPLSLASGLVLHEDGSGTYTAAADDILRNAAALPILR